MPLAPGDLMFVGWDSDNEDVSFIATVPIDAGEVIYFTDDEWNGTEFPGSEQLFEWTVPTGGIAMGTVVTIDMDPGSRSVTFDSGGAVDYIRGGYQLAQGNEMLWAFQGTRVGNDVTPTDFIGVIANEADGNFTRTPELSGTGLTTSNGAIIIDGDEDWMEFTGESNLPDPATRQDLIDTISDLGNWTTADGGGDNNPNPGGGFDISIGGVICFAAGTRIRVPGGYALSEELEPGDLVETLDHGAKPLLWTGRRRVPAQGRFAPVRIAKGVLGNSRTMRVSPQHRMLIADWRADLFYGANEVLVPAHALVNGHTITRAPGGTIDYIHFMFDQHEIVFAEDAASESFFPGKVAISTLERSAREELLTLFPDLRHDPVRYGPSARPVLSPRETRLLVA